MKKYNFFDYIYFVISGIIFLVCVIFILTDTRKQPPVVVQEQHGTVSLEQIRAECAKTQWPTECETQIVSLIASRQKEDAINSAYFNLQNEAR